MSKIKNIRTLFRFFYSSELASPSSSHRLFRTSFFRRAFRDRIAKPAGIPGLRAVGRGGGASLLKRRRFFFFAIRGELPEK